MARIRTIVFNGNGGSKLFDTIFSGFFLGGNLILQTEEKGRRSREKRADDAKVTRHLKSIADVTKGEQEGTEVYRLKPDGGTIEMPQRLHTHLVTYLAAAPMATEQSDRLEDALDFLETAPASQAEGE